MKNTTITTNDPQSVTETDVRQGERRQVMSHVLIPSLAFASIAMIAAFLVFMGAS